jgi:hypothetical protein
MGSSAGYTGSGDSVVAAEPFDPSIAYASYGLYSTVDDLYRWNAALRSGALLPPEQLEAMLGRYVHPRSEILNYGYGMVSTDEYMPEHTLVTHGMPPFSVYPGFCGSTWWLTNPDTDMDMTVIILANRAYNGDPDLNDVVGDIILNTQ